MSQVSDSSINALKVLKVRRTYNQWVADQTLEDFALRFTARKARKMSIRTVALTALGATSFLALESIAAAVTLTYGFVNSLWAFLVVCTILFITGLPIAYQCARNGLDIDLLTRGAGFGYLGSTITSLIYASFTFIFFAIEAAILSSALYWLFGIPLSIGYFICAVVVIPIVLRGITAISKFQIGTQALWLVLQVAALAIVITQEWQELAGWTHYAPQALPAAQSFDWVLFGAAASVLFALVAQIGEQVDYLRFMPEKTEQNKKQWWFWLILSGPGWVWIGLLKLLLGSFLAYLAIGQGLDFETATDPTAMYQRVFSYLLNSEQAALIVAGVMVIVSQMKINVTNAYAGSIAWSNFFSRLTHSHPGRVVWLVFNVALALLLMELGIHKVLESVLSVFALVAVSWLCSIAADLMINRPLGLAPKKIEFKRGHLYDINPVGVGSMVISTLIGLFTYLGWFGDELRTLGHFLSIASCFVCVPLIAILTRGRYYQARPSNLIISNSAEHPVQCECGICQNTLEVEDLLFCPAYQQNICSLCCSLDARCLDQCKDSVWAKSQWLQWFKQNIPTLLARVLFGRAGRFLAWFSLVNGLVAVIFLLIYQYISLQKPADLALFVSGLWALYFTMMIITGVVTWLFLLSYESRRVAQQESNRQTEKLIEEIQAHQITDLKLQEAKEIAERANAAKSRYLSGISHELRTPLQSILGYTQLLSARKEAPPAFIPGLKTIHRSGQYLADLIEGLLDVSKIEAGKLELHITQFSLPDLVQQLTDMFHMQAEAKGIELKLFVHDRLPDAVASDEKRLRQVLINILSNAMKYTEQGCVELHVHYKSQVAQFEVIDTGIGIAREEQSRIFSPFERVHDEHQHFVSGTGLGLTISKLLVEIMGGDIQVQSEPGVGSRFNVKLMLPWVAKAVAQPESDQLIIGYHGQRHSIAIVDDDAVVRSMLADLFRPLGFELLVAADAEECLAFKTPPSLYLVDVNMPGMNGLVLSEILKSRTPDIPVLILSADAQVPHRQQQRRYGYEEYLAKPIDNSRLISTVGRYLKLDWIHEPILPIESVETSRVSAAEAQSTIAALRTSLDIGYKRGVVDALHKMLAADQLTGNQHQRLMDWVEQMQLQRVANFLEAEGL